MVRIVYGLLLVAYPLPPAMLSSASKAITVPLFLVMGAIDAGDIHAASGKVEDEIRQPPCAA